MELKPDLSVHFIECGQGNMTLIVTGTATVLYDCRVVEDDEERIIGHLKTYVPSRTIDGEKKPWIDWFICSHRDQDHIHGLQAVNEQFPIRGIIDPGTTSGSTEGDENKYYMGLRLRLKEKYGDGAVIEPEPSEVPLLELGGVRFYCLCSGVDDLPSTDGHYGNNVFQVEYAGNRVLLTGDSDWRSWKERIVPTFRKKGLLPATILVASHHGSRSFFVDTDPKIDEEDAWEDSYEEHLRLIAPKLTVISCGDQDTHNHPNETALAKYRAGTKYKQVYLTRDKKTLVGRFYGDGTWTITPARFLSGWNLRNYCPSGKTIEVKCEAYKEGLPVGPVRSGSAIPVGHQLRFRVITGGGLVGDASKARYTFEVSNGGMGKDADHDDIYDKGPSEDGPASSFTRALSFVGTHLLRCKVRGTLEAQVVFVVHGLPS